MTRFEFIRIAGGVYTNKEYYQSWGGREKRENFWAFYDGEILDEAGNVKEIDQEILSIYAGIEVKEIIRRQKYSIEHIIPKSFLKEYLSAQGVESFTKRGATTNPFNFAPSHRGLNTARSSFPFDYDGDKVTRKFRISLEHRYTDYGLDFEMEWVVPTKTRGDIARSILYMSLIYGIEEYYGGHLETLITWAKQDPPTFWEKKYNQWVEAQKGINNPFIQYEGNQCLPYSSLLDDDELLGSLLLKPKAPTVPTSPHPVGCPGEIGILRIVAALVNPIGQDTGHESLSLINLSPKPIDLTGYVLQDMVKRSYTIADLSIPAGEVAKVLIDRGDFKLSNKGGKVFLFSPTGTLAHQVAYTKGDVRERGEGYTILFS